MKSAPFPSPFAQGFTVIGLGWEQPLPGQWHRTVVRYVTALKAPKVTPLIWVAVRPDGSTARICLHCLSALTRDVSPTDDRTKCLECGAITWVLEQ